jgi:hypothetical protein
LRKSLSNVQIVVLLSHIALRIKSFTNPRVTPTSRSDARNAAGQRRQNVMGAAAMGLGLHARCTPWFVPIVASKPKYLLNHVVISQYIAVIVSVNKNRVDKLNLICKI